MAKRNDVAAVRWLLDHGVDPDARWTQYESEVTPLHMAAGSGAVEVAGILLAAGADPRIRDTRFESDAIGWAEHFGQSAMRQVLGLMSDK
jgi:ankyrin repeat protein